MNRGNYQDQYSSIVTLRKSWSINFTPERQWHTCRCLWSVVEFLMWHSWILEDVHIHELTQMSCCDGLEPNRLHCPSSQYKLVSTTIETLKRDIILYRNMNLILWLDDPLPIVTGGCSVLCTLSMSIIFISTSVTSIGRSSAHWQYSTTIFISRSTILEIYL